MKSANTSDNEDEEVARATRAALSASSVVGRGGDEQQRSLLEKHVNKHIGNTAPLQELLAKSTEQMNANLAKFGIKLPGGAMVDDDDDESLQTTRSKLQWQNFTKKGIRRSATGPGPREVVGDDKLAARDAIAALATFNDEGEGEDIGSKSTTSSAASISNSTPGNSTTTTTHPHAYGRAMLLSSLTPVASARSLVSNLSPQRVAEAIHAVSGNVSSNATAPAGGSGAVNISSSATVPATTITKTSTTATAISTAITSTNNTKTSSTATAAPPPPAPNSRAPSPAMGLPVLPTLPNDHNSSTISALVWKRREGLGKFAAKNPWERRKLVLEATKLSYFSLTEEEKQSDWATPPPATTATVNGTPALEQVLQWWDSASAATTHTTQSLTGISSPEGPRGTLDLKENAAVTACSCLAYAGATSVVHCAPTPFCLSIRLNDQLKWKLCFDTHAAQLQWLILLCNRGTIQQSMEEYVLDQAKSHPGGANVTCTLDQDTGHYILRNRQKSPTPQKPTITAITNSNETSTELVIAQPPPNTPIGSSQPPPTTPRLSSSTFSTTTNPPSIPVTALNDVQVPFLPLPSIWKRHEMYHLYIRPYLFSKTTNHDNYRPPITLYLIGDRLDIALWSANACVVASYVKADEWSILQFLTYLLILNLVLSLCCATLDDFRYAGAWDHDDAAAFADAVSNRDERTIGKRHQDSPRKWGFGQAATATSPKALPLSPPPPPKAYNSKAGSTTTQVFEEPQPGQISWRTLDSSQFQVRSKGYATTKLKMPCVATLYDCVAVDVLDSPQRLQNLASLAKHDHLYTPSAKPSPWSAPELLVLIISLPSEPPKIGKPVDDGRGLSLIAYFKIKPGTRKLLEFLHKVADHDEAHLATLLPQDVSSIQDVLPGVKLWDEWCERSLEDPTLQGRFKFLPCAVHAEDFPSYMSKYNGKPVLIKRAGVTGIITKTAPGLLQFEINLHAFPYLAKQAFAYMKDTLYKSILGNIAIIVEGRSDDELPEVLIGCFQIAYPDPVLIVSSEDFFRIQDPGAPPKTSTATSIVSNSTAPNNSTNTTSSSSSTSATQNSNPTHRTSITAPLQPTDPVTQ